MSFQPILDAALADYVKQTDIDPTKHPFVDQIQACHTPDDVLKLLEEKADKFKDYRDGNRKLIDCIKPVVNVIHVVSGIISEAASFAPFQPAGAIFAGVDILLAAAGGVSSSYDALVDLFDCVGNFLKRLRIYTNIPSTPSMMEICVKIMVELLSVLALATKQIKLGRFKKFAKKLLGESEIEAVLQRLDRLTQEEGRMTMAQTLEMVHCLMNNVKVVMDDGKVSMDGIRKALDAMQQIASDINKMRRDQLRRDSRSWLSPPDPSINYNNACETHQDGTAMWFFQGKVFTEWNAKGSLLWIYGKPGSGKSILMSSIIREIDRMCKAGFASMAYFFFDFRDTQKQHRRDLLSSLLFQLSAKSDACYHVFSRFYLDHDEGARQPSEAALSRCLMEMLEVQGQPAMYIIIDALDECPDISGMPTPREKVLEFLEDLVGSQLQNAHICLSSRPEFDIRTSLEPLAPFRVPLDDETGQQADILEYIKLVVHSDRRMRNWSAEDKQLVISTLSDKADGMFRWVYCQLENLRRCFPSSLRGTLDSLPKTLDATYERTLLAIDEEKWQFAHRLFQCLLVSVRPLRVEELAEILAVRFDGRAHPQFNTGWKLNNAEEAVLSACSSLISIVNTDGSRIVQFAHFSVKEFLTSDRLATASQNLSRYYIFPHLAHATLAQASLGVLLQLNDRIDKESIRNFPLADYAARHWFSHCQLGNLSSSIQDATKYLFDREKPHFSAWVWIYDIDDPWRKSMPSKHPKQPEATPLYYAILCDFRWLIEYLIVTYPADVNAKGGYFETPLLAAIRKEGVRVNVTSSPPQPGARVYVLENGDMHRELPSERFVIVRLLLEHNADVHLPNEVGYTPLCYASLHGELEISRLLVERGANVHSRGEAGWNPLQAASLQGVLNVARFLIDSGADMNSHDNKGWTPLHTASRMGHVQIVELLIQHGAYVNKQNDDQEIPLHLASMKGNLEISRLLVQRGTDVDSRDKVCQTSLMVASRCGHPDVAQFLIDSGADVNSQDNQGWTSLHLASQEGHMNIVELLNQHGVDLDSSPMSGWTPLKIGSHNGHRDVVRFLLDSGVDVNSHDNDGWTPLHSASQMGHVGIVELLNQHGADVNKKNDYQQTALHVASSTGNLDISRLLVQHGADVDSQDKNNETPLKIVSSYGRLDVAQVSRYAHLDVAQFLIDSGANVDSHDNQGWTPLHSASRMGHVNIVELLIQHGANVDKKNDYQQTALYLASSTGNLEISRLLVQNGADVDSQDKNNETPLKIASRYGHLDVAQFLIDSGANVNSRDNSGWGSLHSASRGGHDNIVELLVQRGADVNSRDKKGWTPLHSAARSGHLGVVRLLLKRGADFSIRDDGDRTPLDLAFVNGQPDVAEFLSGHMAGSTSLDGAVHTTPSAIVPHSNPPNVVHPPRKHGEAVTSHNWQDSLYTASQDGELDIVRSLLDRGSDVNERNTRRETALGAASRQGQLEVAKLLIERGADVDSRDRYGLTPLSKASSRGMLEVARLLLDHGADVNAQTRGRYTALRSASYNGNFEMVQLLLERGANVDVRDANGQTPRHVAIQLGFRRIAELLENTTKGSP